MARLRCRRRVDGSETFRAISRNSLQTAPRTPETCTVGPVAERTPAVSENRMSTEGGSPECDPQKQALRAKVKKAVEKYESKLRRRTHRLTLSRTGKSVPFDKVHLDSKSCDTFQRLMVVVCKAAQDHEPGRGMSLEAFIDFRLAHTDSDASFFEGPLTVPYGAAMDYLGAKNASHEPEDQRAAWVSRGRDPLDWDTINQSQSFDQPTLPGDWAAFLGEERHDEAADLIPCHRESTDTLAEAQLFLTQDLTEVEQMVLLYHDRDGYTFAKIGQDLLPADLFDNSGNAEHKARRIFLKAKAKAQDFRNTDGSDL